MKNKKWLGNGLLLLTALIWGTAFAFQRIGMESIGPITFTAARMLLATIATGLVALLTWKKERALLAQRTAEERKQYRKNTLWGGIWCGIFLSLGSLFQQIGMVETSAGKAGFITAMYILLVPVISFLFFKKKIIYNHAF